MIGVIDYGSGNVSAIATVLNRLNAPHRIVSAPGELEGVDKLVLPGVGAFDPVIAKFDASGLRGAVERLVLEQGAPALGICVGMQIMARSSEEGERPGLGWIDAPVRRIPVDRLEAKPHLPHMGWNETELSAGEPLFEGVEPATGFYFLHSYYIDCGPDQAIAHADYGFRFPVAVRRDHIYGVQFHPEKSHHNGVAVFRNFAAL